MGRKLSMQKAMELAGVKSRNTMKRLIREGYVDAERIPTDSGRGHWRISEDSIVSMLESSLRQTALEHLRGHRV